ncbi:F-box only protein 11, partial [Frankliniella fusca]
MEELPDDVLLILMRYLRLPDLFACRVVCKRFKHLALHPDVWRHRSLKSHLAKDKPNPWVCPVLRLAPCLAELTAELPSVGCHGQLLAMSRCAVSCLRVTARWSGIKDAAFMIRNQEALGRLRHLDLSFGSYDASFGKEGSLIMGVVAAATSRLEHLNVPIFRVDSYELAASSVSHCLITNSSLRSLKCPLTPSSEPFSKTILTAHSSTLEVVRFSLIEFKATPWTNAGAGPLLASMPHLRKLLSPLLPGMESGPACESLTQVDLFLQPDTPACARAAVGVLRRAKQLSKVVLHFSVASPAHISADLLADLAAGRSRATVNTLVVSLPEERDELPG